MQSSLALSVGLPAVLAMIMLGLGLSLRLEDFLRVAAHPKAVIVGLACQTILLPVICLGLVYALSLPPAIAVGMMLLAASPGGTSASIYTHLGRGDVALSITLAAINSVLALVTLPAIVNLSLWLFQGEAGTVYLRIGSVLQIFAFAIVPAIAGVLIHRSYPALAARLERPVRLIATLFLAAVIVFALVGQWRLVGVWGPMVGTAALIFNVISLAVGYLAPRLFGIERRQAIAIAMEVGIHNAALVITLAFSAFMLGNAEMAIPPAMYGVIAYITAAFFIWGYNRRFAT